MMVLTKERGSLSSIAKKIRLIVAQIRFFGKKNQEVRHNGRQ